MRAAVFGSFPNLVQWYNLYVYATFAPYFRTEFFDASDSGSLVYVYAIFALTFVMRPFGSWLFGRLADRRGRRFALVAAVLLMSAGSLALALSPTAGTVGAWAAVILLVVGLVQGVATGGEYGVSAVYLSETATAGRRGFFSSFQAATIVGGQVLAQAVLLVLLTLGDRADVSAWGWRAAFALGAVGGLATLWWAHRRGDAAPRRAAASATLRDLLRRRPRQLLWVILMTAGGTAAFYTDTVTLPTISRAAAGASGGPAAEQAATAVVLGALVLLMVLQPIGGALSDRIGPKPLLVFFGVGGLLTTGAAILLTPVLAAPAALFALLAAVFTVLTGYLSVNTVAKTEAFPADLRALGVGFGYAVANSLFGGTAPMIYHASAGSPWVFPTYVTVLIAVSLAAYLAMPRRSRVAATARAASTSG